MEKISSRKYCSDSGKRVLIRDSIFVREKGSWLKVNLADILWLKAEGNYTTLKTTTGVSHTVRSLLKEFDAVLPSDKFFRVHKSYIVNLNRIEKINTRFISIAKEKIPVGRSLYNRLLEAVYLIGKHT